MKHMIMQNIRTPEDLGIAVLGSPHTAIVPPKRRIDRAEYGRRLAGLQGGMFTSQGYIVPERREESYYGA